jgi:hypothetical protein
LREGSSGSFLWLQSDDFVVRFPQNLRTKFLGQMGWFFQDKHIRFPQNHKIPGSSQRTARDFSMKGLYAASFSWRCGGCPPGSGCCWRSPYR